VTANGPAVPVDQAAACWLVAAGRFAYTANAGSGNIGRYAVARRRHPHRTRQHADREQPALAPARRGRQRRRNYLYVLAQGLHQIVGYRVGPDGSLIQVTTAPVATGSSGVGAN
jgi:6-phosphogluconolactonase